MSKKIHHVIQVPLGRFSKIQSRTVRQAKKSGHAMGPFTTGKYRKVISQCKNCGQQIILRWDEDYDHDPKPIKLPNSKCQ